MPFPSHRDWAMNYSCAQRQQSQEPGVRFPQKRTAEPEVSPEAVVSENTVLGFLFAVMRFHHKNKQTKHPSTWEDINHSSNLAHCLQDSMCSQIE